MKRVTLLGILFIILVSCQPKEKTVFILFDQSEGLSTDHKILLNGASVGEVVDVDITKDYEVLATVELSNSHDFPKDTRFEIQSQDLFTKIILVTLGESETLLENGDTIHGILKNSPPQTPHDTKTPSLLKDLKEMLKN